MAMEQQAERPPASEADLVQAYGVVKRALEAAQAQGVFTMPDSVSVYNATEALESWLKPMNDKLNQIASAAQNMVAQAEANQPQDGPQTPPAETGETNAESNGESKADKMADKINEAQEASDKLRDMPVNA